MRLIDLSFIQEQLLRSIKEFCNYFCSEFPIQSSVSQVAALSAVGNIVIDFSTRKSLFVECGGMKQLVQLTKSMDSTVRLNALWALRNSMFLAETTCKEGIFLELTASSLASLVCGINI